MSRFKWLEVPGDKHEPDDNQHDKSQFNEEPEIGTWKFSTNGVATKGMFDIPSIGFGPGSESHAHSPDDQIKIKDLINAISYYAALTYGWVNEK